MTPHIEANKEDIAKTVIMPGDPLRAKYIAEHFLEDYKLVNTVRNMFAYTGNYKGKRITVFASGMGMPSIGIYSYELYKFYDVENIIRIGSCGSYTSELDLFDIILVKDCYSESSFAYTQNKTTNNILTSSSILNDYILDTCTRINKTIKYGTVYSSDVFYKENDNYEEIRDKYNCLAIEMESFALFNTANMLNKKASCLLTVSDNFITKERATSLEREKGFDEMVSIALESAIIL